MASSHQDSPPPTPGHNSEFPIFADGDVLIKLSDVRSFQLHSVTLRENSTFFKAALVENNAAQLSRKAIREGVVIRYRFEYQLPADEDDSTGQFLLRVSQVVRHRTYSNSLSASSREWSSLRSCSGTSYRKRSFTIFDLPSLHQRLHGILPSTHSRDQ